jgi:hypothetical protein
MIYHELEPDEQARIDEGRETPFTFCLPDAAAADEAEAAKRLHEAVEEASTWLALRGVGGVHADGPRGRLWTDREESGKAYIFLMDRYPVKRHQGHNLVDIG